MKKRCDNPYGDIASVVALARANEKVPVLHLCICDNKECGKFFKSSRRTTKYCPACRAALKKGRHQKWLKKSKDKKGDCTLSAKGLTKNNPEVENCSNCEHWKKIKMGSESQSYGECALGETNTLSHPNITFEDFHCSKQNYKRKI